MFHQCWELCHPSFFPFLPWLLKKSGLNECWFLDPILFLLVYLLFFFSAYFLLFPFWVLNIYIIYYKPSSVVFIGGSGDIMQKMIPWYVLLSSRPTWRNQLHQLRSVHDGLQWAALAICRHKCAHSKRRATARGRLATVQGQQASSNQAAWIHLLF